jgi:tRNA (guanine10-N2)-dimethyltransferase
VNVQDIEGYAARDQARPYRDARVGMLPPKLAQTIINLGASSLEPTKQLLLDPFCGTGVVLQEAGLMGFDVYGTDINPRMVEYTIGNLHWLREKFDVAGEYVRIELGDATKHKWQKPIDIVACETFLGQPLMSLPNSEHLSKIIYEANLINHNFIKNLAPQLKSGTRICLAVPAWRGIHEFLHLPMLDHLTELGYNRVKFVHASKSDLIYHRENQVVARELVVLVKE